MNKKIFPLFAIACIAMMGMGAYAYLWINEHIPRGKIFWENKLVGVWEEHMNSSINGEHDIIWYFNPGGNGYKDYSNVQIDNYILKTQNIQWNITNHFQGEEYVTLNLSEDLIDYDLNPSPHDLNSEYNINLTIPPPDIDNEFSCLSRYQFDCLFSENYKTLTLTPTIAPFSPIPTNYRIILYKK